MLYRRFEPHQAIRFAPLHRPGDARVKTLAVPGYRQVREYSCGFACALMVAHYFAADVPARLLFQRLGTSRDGTRQGALVRALRESGLRANVRYDVDFARIRREIERDKLVIAYLHDADHWVVLYGYGSYPERLFVLDPRPGESCEQIWRPYGDRLGGFGIICSLPPRRDAPSSAAGRLASGARGGDADAPAQLAFDFLPTPAG